MNATDNATLAEQVEKARDEVADLKLLREWHELRAEQTVLDNQQSFLESWGSAVDPLEYLRDDPDYSTFGRGSYASAQFISQVGDRADGQNRPTFTSEAELSAIRGAARITIVIDESATGKRLVDLRIQILTVSQDDEREVAAQLAMDLPCEENHRVALARSLRMPEYAELALSVLAISNRLDGAIHTEELVVASEDLHWRAHRVVEDDEVLHQVDEGTLVAHALKQRLHVDRAR